MGLLDDSKYCPSCNQKAVKDGICYYCCFITEGYEYDDPCIMADKQMIEDAKNKKSIEDKDEDIIQERIKNDKLRKNVSIGIVIGLIILVIIVYFGSV